MYNSTNQWGQAFYHWCLAVLSLWYTWLHKGVTFVFFLSFSLSLPFDWTLRYWVCVCCFVLLFFGCYVMLCMKNKKMLITKKNNNVPQCQIAKALQISSSTEHNIINRFREAGEISVRKGQGRRPLLDARGLRALRQHCITQRQILLLTLVNGPRNNSRNHCW